MNNKYLVRHIWDGVESTTTIVNSGDTIINNDTINISGGTTLVSGGTVNLGSGSTIISGSTSTVTDNGDGTYTHDNGVIPSTTVTIKPADYSYTESKTGEKWVNGKDIYRKVVVLPQWAASGDEDGSYLLGTGKTFEIVVRLDVFATIPNPLISPTNPEKYVINLNVGDRTKWSGRWGYTMTKQILILSGKTCMIHLM